MRELIIDTSRRMSEKNPGVWETLVSTPYSSTSTMSTSNQLETSSDAGSDSLSPSTEVNVKSESAPSPPLGSPHDPISPTERSNSRITLSNRDRMSADDHKRIRVNERSKTGCITCRKRKKKCDEAKPYCMRFEVNDQSYANVRTGNNCTKTNYVCDAVISLALYDLQASQTCEGYPSRKYWHPPTHRPGRSRVDENGETDRSLILPPHQSLPTFAAVENEDDQLFLSHYITKTSHILCINDAEEGNPWTEIILPMAKDDQALMHSVLAFSGSHLMRTRNDQRLNDRQMFHVDAMLSGLRKRLDKTPPGGPDAAPVMASMIFQFLLSKNDVTRYGTPQACLKAARSFLQAPGTPFWRFAWGFCKYHEFSTTFTSLPGTEPRPNFTLEQGGGSPSENPRASATTQTQNFNIMVGLVDVPFMTLISKITALRDQVRHRQTLQRGASAVHYSMLVQADELGRDIKQWHSGQTEGTPRHVAAELYRRAALLYLLRTVRAASSQESRVVFAKCVAQGLECLRLLPPDDAVQSSLLLPTFILGCGAFETQHRADLGRALDAIECYSGFGNVKPVRAILHRIWEIMDAGDIERSWDWETITQEMGFAALIT